MDLLVSTHKRGRNMDQSGKVKTKKRWVVVSSCIVAFLAISFISLSVWTGTVGLGGPVLCQKPGTLFIWPFAWDEKTNALRAIGNDKQTCDFHSGPKVWQPFALRTYERDSKGICLNMGEPFYNFKQGASGLGGSYRLDIVEDEPFFQTDADKKGSYADPKDYCDDTQVGWCRVILVPVCAVKKDDWHWTFMRCNKPDIRADNVSGNYGPTEALAAIMLENQKGGGEGFRYILSEHSQPLSGGIAVAEGLRGQVRCYYQQGQRISQDGKSRVAATRDEAVQACMNVLTDRNRYCRSGDGLPHFEQF